MKARGFTLLEMVIVLVLIGISAVFGSRFIADMASNQVASAERAQALSGARFALERLRRELSQAYSPSVYVQDQCVSFVPAIAAGSYEGQVKAQSARFMLPLTLQNTALDTYIAVNAPSGITHWDDYPHTLPENVAKFTTEPTSEPIDYRDVIVAGSGGFNLDTIQQRFTLLAAQRVQYCVDGAQLIRVRTTLEGSSAPVIMLSGIKASGLNYNSLLQLLMMELTLSTRDGDLVLPTQLQVHYEP